MRRFIATALVVAMTALFIGGPALYAKKDKDKDKKSAKIEDLINDGKYQKAIDLAKKFEEKGQVTEGLYIDMGTAYYRLNQYKEAIDAFEKAAEQNPFGTQALLYEASCYDKLNQPDKIIDTYNRVVELDSGNVTALQALGVLFEKQGKPKLALEKYKAAYDSDPNAKGLAFSIGALQYGQREYSDAEAYLEKAAETELTNPQVFLALGQNQLKLKKYDKAADSLQKFVDMTQSETYKAPVLNMVAYCYEQQKNWEKALEVYDKILTIKPNYSKALRGKGNAQIALKKYAEARKTLESYLQYTKDNDKKKDEVREVLKKLEKTGAK